MGINMKTVFNQGGEHATPETRKMIEQACETRIPVAFVHEIARDMGARVAIVDDRDRHVTYDMHIVRMLPDWDREAERGAQVIRIRVACSNDWDDDIDVYDRCAQFDPVSWDHALINGRLYRRAFTRKVDDGMWVQTLTLEQTS